MLQVVGSLKVCLYTFCLQAWSSTTERDVRAAMLLLLAARCKGSLGDTAAIGGSSFFVNVLNDRDPRVRHISASFLQVGPDTAILHLACVPSMI